MGLDIRWPIGLMFSLIGALLIIEGAVAGGATSVTGLPLGANVNLLWGILLLIFGVLMLLGALRASHKKPEGGEGNNRSHARAGGA